ncbi:preprotein translocase subunit SecE [Desulfobotulus sp.]|jgi:preprotein translocase subunit SecE|uniref:preprotein translocase subunit SecE n=1 Tax=Desulfobotulus sp. TaxID=1940337 RepID=UPI002A36584B|nr:preprotein translocase subunit SecE [Desulfobotulus sp.]MDY0163608.1 preprotein translocase subunit SecE [Desulfobotulus sp.]
MGRLLKKKTENQLQKKKLKIKATQDENAETPSAEVKSRKSGEISIAQTEKASKDPSASRSVARPVKKTAVAKGLEFFQEARAELLKVVWPSRTQAMASTGVVIVLVIILSFFLGIADAVLTRLVQLALN